MTTLVVALFGWATGTAIVGILCDISRDRREERRRKAESDAAYFIQKLNDDAIKDALRRMGL